MPIQVQGPDGQMYEFPDGTDRETMRSALAKRYGSPSQPRPDFSNVQSGSSSVPAREAKPSLFRMDSDFRERSGVGMGSMLTAAAKDMFGSRQGAAEYLARKINENQGLSSLITGGAKVDVGDNGDPVLRLADGTSYRLNDPGIDFTDIANVAGNVAAFWAPAAWASRFNKARNLGLVGRAGTQGGAAVGTDVALQGAFNGGNIDPVRTVAAGVGGSGGEVVGTAVGNVARSGVNYFNRATGRNADQAANVLREQGLTPTRESVNALAPRIPELEAGANPNALIGAERYGFTYTQGQRATDPRQKFDLLSREELLRQSPAGGHVLREAATRNAEQLDTALSGITRNVGGDAVPDGPLTPAQLTQAAAVRLRQQADELDVRVSDAYNAAGQGGRTAVSTEAVRGLPQRLRTSVADFAPNATTTPVTARTLAQMSEAVAALPAGGSEGRAVGVTLKALETQRRILNNNINAATNNADRAAMVKIKREFDAWMDEAIDTALVSGDPTALQSIKEARALRAEYGRRFEGSSDSDRFIAGLLDGTRTPEELINIALGASQVSKAGGARFIERLRRAAGDDPQVIGNLRAAHFLRLSRGNDGQPLPMGQIIRNIRTSDYNNASVVRALYSPEQWAEIRRLAASMEPLVAKGDFARTSGTAERLARMFGSAVSGGFTDLPVIRGILQGVRDVRQLNQARAALNQPLPLPGSSGPIIPSVTAASATDGAR